VAGQGYQRNRCKNTPLLVYVYDFSITIEQHSLSKLFFKSALIPPASAACFLSLISSWSFDAVLVPLEQHDTKGEDEDDDEEDKKKKKWMEEAEEEQEEKSGRSGVDRFSRAAIYG
jgi:hypothetical protein